VIPDSTSAAGSQRGRIGGLARIAAALARRPSLWPTALRQAHRTAGRRWWRHRPFLPLPSGAYLAFRLQTQYGETGVIPEPGDVLKYLAWCREWERTGRR
jgi:hypothetical protein